MPITLTPEDRQRLQDKQFANVPRKLNEGKTLTKREEEILARGGATVPQAPDEAPSAGFAKSWDDLAAALHVEERTLFNFRQKHAAEIKRLGRTLTRADGRHVVGAWRELADTVGELKGRGLNDPDLGPDAAVNIRDMRIRQQLHELRRAEHKLAVEIREVLPLTEYQHALRVLLTTFDTGLREMPLRAAARIRPLIHAAVASALKSQLTPKQFAKIEPQLEKILPDVNALAAMLDADVEHCRGAFAAADFMASDEEGDGEPEEITGAEAPGQPKAKSGFQQTTAATPQDGDDDDAERPEFQSEAATCRKMHRGKKRRQD